MCPGDSVAPARPRLSGGVIAAVAVSCISTLYRRAIRPHLAMRSGIGSVPRRAPADLHEIIHRGVRVGGVEWLDHDVEDAVVEREAVGGGPGDEALALAALRVHARPI